MSPTRLIRIFIVAFVIAAVGPAWTDAKADAGKQLAAVFASSDEINLKLVPQSGLSRGDLRYADQFGDLISDEFHKANEKSARDDLAALLRVDRNALNGNDKMAYDAFKYGVEYIIKSYDEGLYKIGQMLPLDSVFGAHIQFSQVNSGAGIAPFNTVQDYENGLKRIVGFVVYLDRAEQMMRRGIAQKITQPRAITQAVAEQLDEAIKGGVENSPFIGPVQNFPKDFSAAEQTRLSAAYRAAVKERILPAYVKLKKFMDGEYLIASRAGTPGLVGIPNGAAYYKYVLESFLTVSISPDKIFTDGEKEVARIRAEMEAVKKKVGFKGTLGEFFEDIRTNPKFKIASKTEFFARYDAIKAKVEPLLPKYFGTMPKAKLEIREIPADQSASSGWAYYQLGAADGSRPGVFYANVANLPARTTPRMTALFLHEGEPGHHFQGSVAQENESLPAFLRFGFQVAPGEGWALYAESLGIEMGLYADPYQYFGRLDMEMLRAVRMVIDTGLHAKGWTRQQAVDYMLEFTSLDQKSVEAEVDRYIVWPGQAPAYKVGELFIRRLRTKAEKELGAKFDIRAFHDQVLTTGVLPLAVMEQKIDAWIRATKA